MPASVSQYNLEGQIDSGFMEGLKRPDITLKTQIQSSLSLLFRQQRDHHGLQLSRDSVFFGYVWPLSQAPHHQAWERRVQGRQKDWTHRQVTKEQAAQQNRLRGNWAHRPAVSPTFTLMGGRQWGVMKLENEGRQASWSAGPWRSLLLSQRAAGGFPV